MSGPPGVAPLDKGGREGYLLACVHLGFLASPESPTATQSCSFSPCQAPSHRERFPDLGEGPRALKWPFPGFTAACQGGLEDGGAPARSRRRHGAHTRLPPAALLSSGSASRPAPEVAPGRRLRHPACRHPAKQQLPAKAAKGGPVSAGDTARQRCPQPPQGRRRRLRARQTAPAAWEPRGTRRPASRQWQ